MAAPTYVQAPAGAVDAGAAFLITIAGTGGTAGNIIVVQLLQDGTEASTISLTTNFSGPGIIENLAGTDDSFTSIGTFDIGSAAVAKQHLWICRRITTGLTVFNGSGAVDDMYYRCYEFTDCSAGTTLATVIENGTAGSTVNSAGTSGTIADASVQTLGPDRLALNLVGISDDNAVAAFTGQSGGTWVEAVAEYANASGTDGCIQLQTAAMASAGTIDGGTTTNSDATDGWGAVGFALIGTTQVSQGIRQARYVDRD